MNSLQNRLGLGIALTATAILAALFALAVSNVRTLAEAQMRERLAHDAESLLAAAAVTDDGLRLAPESIDVIYHQPFSGHYFRVSDGAGTLRSRSLWDEELSGLPAADANGGSFHVAGPRGQPLLLYQRRYRKQGRDIEIATAEDLTALNAEVRRFQWQLAGLTTASLCLLLLVQRRVLRASLRPLQKTRRELARLQRGEQHRLNEQVPEEIAPLVHAFNQAIGSWAGRAERSRKALGNLAHGLKTPLAVLTQLADDPDLAARADLRAAAHEHTGRIRQLIDRELRRARIVGLAAPGQRVEVAQSIADLVETLKVLHRERGLTVESRVPPGLTFAADRQDFLELAGNLLDNAFKWATARVRVTAEPNPASLELCIEDDGPGLAPGEDAAALTRGRRLDESVTGHGLGLAIAQDVVEQYRGRLDLSRSDALGGLRVAVSLPVPAVDGIGHVYGGES
jgi:signal transduction histidine kinase